MRHITKRSEYYAACRVEPRIVDIPERLLACTGEFMPVNNAEHTVLPMGHVQYFFERPDFSVELPDCPQCAVLWDQAVAAGEVVKQKALDKAAWIKADEDDNEKFWETLNTGHKYRRSDT